MAECERAFFKPTSSGLHIVAGIPALLEELAQAIAFDFSKFHVIGNSASVKS